MKKYCDKVFTSDDFDESYSSWKGRSITIMDEQIKVSQSGLKPRYFDTIYLFEEIGLLVGFTYGELLPICYISTTDGLESEPLADVAPYLFYDMHHIYTVVKKHYRNDNLKKHVIGLNILEIPSLNFIYDKSTWPMWESIESIRNGAVLIKKADSNYGLTTLDKFPACNIVNCAPRIISDKNEENVYHVYKSTYNNEVTIMDISKKLAKINKKYDIK